ncbi:hypothetical protein KXD93_12810 [Mucilaginibacter sp. BJC16-A38]|uniref:hypothetical protein n=1 Tax=Mucilaginibacter phenanthrenivorans TaxID=1234842 RepID=UPI00215733F0|nr:hypothetical protein [Mucilaginibacter phenanthrenivorans]MCR8558529.1 hypothetical protein [Mucilaginibacter phenanthrenivorans]
MKTFKLLIIAVFILSGYTCHAQITLNAAVDTVQSATNRAAIHTLSDYLHARLNKKDGKSFWLPSEAANLKTYDLYDAHSLYEIKFDEIIILGITQPETNLFKIKVLFSYFGSDKVRTIWSINDFYLTKLNGLLKLTNALFVNMRITHYQTVKSPCITYHFPAGYAYHQALIDSANHYLGAIEKFFNKKLPGNISYITAPACENLYATLGASYQAGTMSSSTTFCGFFDMDNRMIITSGNEYYLHELLRTLNMLYPGAPDLLKSGITTLWGGSANKPAIYHLKKLYPYLIKHPEVLNKLDDFYYFDDETNPSFIFQAVVINYVLKHEGKDGLIKLMNTLKPDISAADFLKDHYHINDVQKFFLDEFKYYNQRNRLEFDDLLAIK